jgi:hypothetical protein
MGATRRHWAAMQEKAWNQARDTKSVFTLTQFRQKKLNIL